MLNMFKRSYEPEIMDCGPAFYTMAEYNDCLSKLGYIGIFLGGDRATLKAFKTLPFQPTSILDVGCGGGSFTLKLATSYPNAQVTGSDITPHAIAYARIYKESYEETTKVILNNVNFIVQERPELMAPEKSVDIVTATLVLHHLTDEQIIDFFKRAKRIACKAIIINDLHRHWLSYILFACIAPLFNNRLIHYDGLLSIKKSFKRNELEQLLLAAGFAQDSFSITRRFAFRWLIVVDLL